MSSLSQIAVVCLVGAALWAQDWSSAGKVAAPHSGDASTQTPPDSTKLEPIETVKPVYPPGAEAKGIGGTVVVKMLVDETGRVDNAEVVSGDPVLASSCVDALRQWKFKPFIKNGNPIKVAASFPCNFVAPSAPPPVVLIRDLSDKSKPRDARSPTVLTLGSAPPDSTALVLIKKAKPNYPLEAETDQIQGEVVVKLLVDENGDVAQTLVVSGNPILANSLVGAVKKWKFEPFIRNGKPIQVATAVTYDFAFKDKIIVDRLNDPAAMNQSPGLVPDNGVRPAPPQAVQVAGGVIQGLCIYKVQPVYPVEAKWARIQGTVVLAAIIGKDGRVKSLRVVSGRPELADAAVGAVEQWRYRPYLLLGQPVEVDTTITVYFQLREF